MLYSVASIHRDLLDNIMGTEYIKLNADKAAKG
jgi:hypothetical protein